jgi:general secretion pathway protein I
MKRPGFTLLEVILALAILAGSLVVLGEVSRLALRNAASARDLARAQMLAETKMAEIEAGITTPDSIDNATFDAVSESLDSGEPAWTYSIDSQSTDEDGLISVRVTVTRDQPAGQHPPKFTLVRWLPDPNYSASQTGEQDESSSSDSSSSSSGGS